MRELEVGDSDALRLRVHRDQFDIAFRVSRNVAQVAVRLPADEVRQARHERGRLGGDAASTFGLVALRDHMDAEGRAVKASEIQIELGFTLVAGGGLGQGLGELFLHPLRIVELVAAMAGETRERRRERHGRSHAAIRSRRAEQILQRNARAQIVRRHPALDRFRRKARAHLHAIGQKFLHLHRERTDLVRGQAVLHDIELHGVIAGRRGVERSVLQFLQARARELQSFAPHDLSARVGDLRFERNAGEFSSPVGGFYDHADPDFIARPIDAAVGEQIRRKLAAVERIRHAADLEAREVEHAVAARDRQEGTVAELAYQIEHGLAFALEALQIRNRCTPGAVGHAGHHRQTVLAEHVHRGARNRLAAVDRLHENVLAAVERFLDQDAEVGDDDQPLVTTPVGRLAFGSNDSTLRKNTPRRPPSPAR